MNMKREIKRDVFHTINFFNGKTNINYGRVFYNSNEILYSLFESFDFKNKDIFSVMGSGDQIFHFINRGALNVDTFDINKLTKYYFCLRLWSIKYLNKYYPGSVNYDFISNLLSIVEVNSQFEKEAYIYWSILLKYLDHYNYEHILINDEFSMSRNRIDDLEELKNKLNNKSFSFKNIDFSKNFNIDRNYDYIFLSNIKDWVCVDSTYRNNIDKLLRPGGYVICSTLGSYGASSDEIMLLDMGYDYYELPDVYDGSFTDYQMPGYYFVKK